MTWRRTAFDAARIQILLNPPWLLAPLFAKDAAFRLSRDGSTPGDRATHADGADPAAQWQGWWDAAVAFRPGEPAPTPQSLLSGSPGLALLWQQLEPDFQRWIDARPHPVDSRVEQQELAGFEHRNSRTPAARTFLVMVVPAGGGMLLRPEPERLIVSDELRENRLVYLPLLREIFDDFF